MKTFQPLNGRMGNRLRVVTASLLLGALTLALGSEGNADLIELEGHFTKVWFKGARLPADIFLQVKDVSPETPLVGIEIKMADLESAILKAVGKPLEDGTPNQVDVAQLQKAIAALNPVKDSGTTVKAYQTLVQEVSGKNYWCVDWGSAISDPDHHTSPMCRPVAFQHLKDSLVIVANPQGSYNDQYCVTFDVAKFLTDHQISYREGVEIKTPRIRYEGRFDFSFESDLANDSITLIKGAINGDGKFEGEKAKGAQGTLKFGYQGFGNFLQNAPFKEHSFYSLSLDATLTSNIFDNESKIEFGLSGVTDLLPTGKDMITVTGAKFLTSQNNRQNTFVYELCERFGDRRSTDQGFVASDDTLGPIYGEAALQAGFSTFRALRHVPDPDLHFIGILRPRLSVGVHDLFKKQKSPVTLEGKVDFYYLLKNYGGGDKFDTNDNGAGWRTVFSASLKYGNDDKFLQFSVEGGRNPAQGFVKVKPTYSIGVGFKF